MGCWERRDRGKASIQGLEEFQISSRNQARQEQRGTSLRGELLAGAPFPPLPSSLSRKLMIAECQLRQCSRDMIQADVLSSEIRLAKNNNNQGWNDTRGENQGRCNCYGLAANRHNLTFDCNARIAAHFSLFPSSGQMLAGWLGPLGRP